MYSNKLTGLQMMTPKEKKVQNDNIILSKFVCLEADEMEHELQHIKIMYGIADKGVDRLTDIVISQ